MLYLSLRDVDDLQSKAVAQGLRANEGRLCISVTITCLNFGSCFSDIAHARLAVWYIAEMLADFGSDVTVEERENEDGSGDVRFCATIRPDAIDAVADKLCWMAPAFDPNTNDDGTAMFDFGCEIVGWAEDRGASASRFPELQIAYETDAAAATEQIARDEDMD